MRKQHVDALDELAEEGNLTYTLPARDSANALEAVERYVEESNIGIEREGHAEINLKIKPYSNGPGWYMEIRTENPFSRIDGIEFEDAKGYVEKTFDTAEKEDSDYAYLYFHQDLGAEPGEPRSAADLEDNHYAVRVWRKDTPQRIHKERDEAKSRAREAEKDLEKIKAALEK